MSDCSSGAVEFVFGMKNEENFESFNEFRVRSVVGFVEPVQHVEEVLNISETFMRFVVLSSDSVSVGISCDSWNTSQQSIDLFVSDLFVFVDRFSNQTRVLFRMKSGKCSHCTTKHAHRMSVISEGVHHAQ